VISDELRYRDDSRCAELRDWVTRSDQRFLASTPRQIAEVNKKNGSSTDDWNDDDCDRVSINGGVESKRGDRDIDDEDVSASLADDGRRPTKSRRQRADLVDVGPTGRCRWRHCREGRRRRDGGRPLSKSVRRDAIQRDAFLTRPDTGRRSDDGGPRRRAARAPVTDVDARRVTWQLPLTDGESPITAFIVCHRGRTVPYSSLQRQYPFND